jgi:3-dehydroquinate dehydratase-1
MLRAPNEQMKSSEWVKQKRASSRLVAVIASPRALDRAKRLRIPPDFFELRLDALAGSLGKVTSNVSYLRAPIILTARHPEEGGLGSLTLRNREALLRRFLDFATLVDLEVRCIRQMARLLLELRRRKIALLLSSHHLDTTPTVSELHRLTKRAAVFRPAIFKLATRIDERTQLERLATYLSEATRYPFPIAVMGVGRLGFLSRRQFDRTGSALTYATLDRANIEGQPTLAQLRAARRAYHS